MYADQPSQQFCPVAQELGLGQAEVTPGETATAAETDGDSPRSVSARRVIESGSLGA